MIGEPYLLIDPPVLASLTQDCFDALGLPADDAREVPAVNATPRLHYHYQGANPQEARPVANEILRELLGA
jgi:hypothetical protein